PCPSCRSPDQAPRADGRNGMPKRLALRLKDSVKQFCQRHPRFWELVSKCRILLRPRSAQPYLALGNALSQRGKTLDAVATFRRALNLQPDSVEAILALGNALLAGKQPVEAEEVLCRGLAFEPQSVEFLTCLGHALAAQERITEARDLLRQAVA